MLLQTTQADADTIVTVQSIRLDALIAPQFGEDMRQIVNGGAQRIVLDIGAVQIIDSSGLAILVSILKALNGQNGSMVIRNASPTVLNLFKLTRMDRVFTITAKV